MWTEEKQKLKAELKALEQKNIPIGNAMVIPISIGSYDDKPTDPEFDGYTITMDYTLEDEDDANQYISRI